MDLHIDWAHHARTALAAAAPSACAACCRAPACGSARRHRRPRRRCWTQARPPRPRRRPHPRQLHRYVLPLQPLRLMLRPAHKKINSKRIPNEQAQTALNTSLQKRQ